MASDQGPLDVVDQERSLAGMSSDMHTEVDDDMVPLQISESDNVDSDDIDASFLDFLPSVPFKSTVPRSRAKKARKGAHRSREQQSKPYLRPVKDILSRIRHDPALEESDFVVGYRDRHAPEVMEMDVSVWKGGGDFTDEEWIPQHRILYFRKRGDEPGRRVWDRELRLDRLFGSGIVTGIQDQNASEGGEASNGSDYSNEIVDSSCEIGQIESSSMVAADKSPLA